MTDISKEAVDALLHGVTAGPWTIKDCESLGYRSTDYYQEIWNDETDILVTTEVTRAHNDGGAKNMRFIAAARELVPALRAALDEAEARASRFPDHMAQIVAAKNEGLPERISKLVEAIKSIPENMRQYQWQADEKQAFGSKWVRTIAGDNGKGMGRQAIAEVVSHIGVADFIAAANPDTVSMLIAALVKAEAERDAANALLRDGLLTVQTGRNEPLVIWSETVAAHLGAKP